MSNIHLQEIRESFGKVAYSHKTHEKAAEIESSQVGLIKWVNIILTTLTSGTLVGTIVTNETALLYIGGVFSSFTLAFAIFQLSFNPEKAAEKHRQTAKELWLIREKYLSLIADVLGGELSNDTITSRRDQLIADLHMVYKFAPATTSKAYKKAQEALQINEELTFSDVEIDKLLPKGLRRVDNSKSLKNLSKPKSK